MLRLRGACGHRYVVVQAEPHAAVGCRVVARWANQRETVARLPVQHRVHHVAQPAGREPSRLLRVGTDIGVGVEIRTPQRGQCDSVEVLARVDPQQPLIAGRRARHVQQRLQRAAATQQIPRAAQPLTVLRVAGLVVTQVEGIVADG